jgi:hypothetical protein
MRRIASLVLLLLAVTDLSAQQTDFDYLLGDWSFTTTNKQWGKAGGVWSAVRLVEGQILDEFRIVGDSGSTIYVTTTIRNYNQGLKRWELIGADAGGGLQDFGVGHRVGGEMHIEQEFGSETGQRSKWRIRYYNIQPNSFSWTADRSLDGGRTWDLQFMTIEAKRIGAARALPALTPRPSLTSKATQ